jgi:hypothetical protein
MLGSNFIDKANLLKRGPRDCRYFYAFGSNVNLGTNKMSIRGKSISDSFSDFAVREKVIGSALLPLIED